MTIATIVQLRNGSLNYSSVRNGEKQRSNVKLPKGEKVLGLWMRVIWRKIYKE